GRLGKLAQEAPGRLEGLVDVPQGTGAAETRELEPRGRVALGDRARLIDADEEEGNALHPRPLQGGQPVRYLFDRGAEAVGEAFEIVPGFLRCRQERAVGQERGTREIVG